MFCDDVMMWCVCVFIQASGDKDQRTLVHRAIREHFPALESKTVDGVGEEGRIIQVTYSGEKKGMWTIFVTLTPDCLQHRRRKHFHFGGLNVIYTATWRSALHV